MYDEHQDYQAVADNAGCILVVFLILVTALMIGIVRWIF